MRTNTIAIPGHAGLLTLLAFVLMPQIHRAEGLLGSNSLGQQSRHLIQEWADDKFTRVIIREAESDDTVEPQAVTYNYDNLNEPGFGGNSLPIRNVRTGGNEVGDDLLLVNNTGGRLSGAGWSLANFATTGILSRWTQTYRWYDENRNLIRSFSFITDIGSQGVRPGEGVRLGQRDGFWTPFNITLPNRVYMSVQFSSVVGIDLADVGVSLWGPITLGASERTYFDFTANQFVDPGQDRANLAAFVRTEVIPSPAAAVIFALWFTKVATRRCRQ